MILGQIVKCPLFILVESQRRELADEERGEISARTCNMSVVHPAVGRQEEGTFQDGRTNMCFK